MICVRPSAVTRRISLSRELTKLHEETLCMTLAEAVAYFAETARAVSLS